MSFLPTLVSDEGDDDDIDSDDEDADGNEQAEPSQMRTGVATRPPRPPTARGGAPRRRPHAASMDMESVFTAGDDGFGVDDDIISPTGGMGDKAERFKRYKSRKSFRLGSDGSGNLGRSAGASGSGGAAGAASMKKSGAAGSRSPSLGPNEASAAAPDAGTSSAVVPYAGGNASKARPVIVTRGSGPGSGAVAPSLLPLTALPQLMSPHGGLKFSNVAAMAMAAAGSPTAHALSLSPFRDHLLICGMSDSIGLLLRALQMPAAAPPKAYVPGLAQVLSHQVGHWAEQRRLRGGAGLDKGPQIVVLCPVSDRPSDAVVNAMHAGSSRWLSRVTWVNGNPNDLSDLLRAGVETARAAVVLSTKRPQANPDGNDNLADDTDAIVVASAIYKLNARLHIVTELIHGPHASYLRPCGTNLTDAEESTSAFVASVRATAALRMKFEARQRRAAAERERAQAAMAAHAVAREKLASPTGAARAARPAIVPSRSAATALPPPPPPRPTPSIGASTSSSAAAAGVPPAALLSAAARASPALAPVHAPNTVSAEGILTVSAAAFGLSPIPEAAPVAAAATPPADSTTANGLRVHAPDEATPGSQEDDSAVATVATMGAAGSADDDPAKRVGLAPIVSPITPPMDAQGAAVPAAPTPVATTGSEDDGTGHSSDPAAPGMQPPESLAEEALPTTEVLVAAAPASADNENVDSTGQAAAAAWTNRMARERIRLALGTGDSVGRTAMAVRPHARPGLSSVFGGAGGLSGAAGRPPMRPSMTAVNAAAATSAAASAVGPGAGAGAGIAMAAAADTQTGDAAAGALADTVHSARAGSAPPAASDVGRRSRGASLHAPEPSSPIAPAGRGGGSASDVVSASAASAAPVDEWSVGLSMDDDADPWASAGAAAVPASAPAPNMLRSRATSFVAGIKHMMTPSFGGSASGAAGVSGLEPLSLGPSAPSSLEARADQSDEHQEPQYQHPNGTVAVTIAPAAAGGSTHIREAAGGVGLLSSSSGTTDAGLLMGAGSAGNMTGALRAAPSTDATLAPLAHAPSAGASAQSSGADSPTKAVAPNDLFGAPAFAAGRAFSATTLDALMCEAHFAPHIIFIVKQLVRASRKQRLQLLPITDAIAMAMLVLPTAVSGEVLSPPHRSHGQRTPPTSPGGGSGGGSGARPRVRTYGQLFEALLRGWHLLPLGLYRRLEPGTEATPPVVTDAATHFMNAFAHAGSTSAAPTGAAALRNDKALLSYVFTNPPPDTTLNVHDLVYVLRAGSAVPEDDDGGL